MPTEIHDTESEAYKKFGEVAATTGRIRRVGWLDLELVRTAVELSGVTETLPDQTGYSERLEKIQVCVNYKLDGKAVRYADVDTYGLDRVSVSIKQSLAGRKISARQGRSRNCPPTRRGM
jgi:adenylosuccinate synthase